jgi:hypothetical protein
MDVFTWSMPFVSEKVLEILHQILVKACEGSGISKDDIKKSKPTDLKRGVGGLKKFNPNSIKCKVNFLGKCMNMQKNLRENRELFMELKGMCPDNKIP